MDAHLKMDNEPAASIAPEGSKLNSMFVSPRQGALVFTASEPVLRGKRRYEDSFCGSEDVLGMPFADKNEPDNNTYLKPNADGTLELQLLVRDGKDNPNYRFTSINVLGGYQLGDTVVLDTLGKADNGWIVRGPVMLTRNSEGKFTRSGGNTLSYPE